MAQAPDPITFAVGGAVTHDDNLFRLAPGATPPIPGKSARADLIRTVYAGFQVDKTYSLQRFQWDMTATRYDYQRYTHLNFSGLDYRGAWLWSLTPHLTGSLTADRREALTSYADFSNTLQRNIQTRESRRLTADWGLGGAWHLMGGVSELRTRNSATFTAVGNVDQEAVEAGLRYVSAANNDLALVHRVAQGTYRGRVLGPALLDTAYDQGETEILVNWRLSGHSAMDARLAYQARDHAHYAQRDFAGLVGALHYLWTPTDKLRINLDTGREQVSYQETTALYSSSYYTNTYLGIAPTWQWTEKTALRLKFDLIQRAYRGGVAAALMTRDDTIHGALFGVRWQPTRTLELDTYIARDQRSSNTGLSYLARTIGLSANLRF